MTNKLATFLLNQILNQENEVKLSRWDDDTIQLEVISVATGGAVVSTRCYLGRAENAVSVESVIDFAEKQVRLRTADAAK